MSEPFVVPKQYLRIGGQVVDVTSVPVIVRTEVERALKWANWANGNPIGEALDAPDLRYLDERFPEPPEVCGKFVNGIIPHCQKPLHHSEPCSVPAPSAETQRGKVTRNDGGDCDVCHRPSMEPQSVVRFSDGTNEFYVCQSCYQRGAPRAETATPEPKECACTGRPCPYNCGAPGSPYSHRCNRDVPCHGTKCFHATGIREGDTAPDPKAFVWNAPKGCTACPCARCQAAGNLLDAIAQQILGVDGDVRYQREVFDAALAYRLDRRSPTPEKKS